LEERVREIAVNAFVVADAIHENCMGDGVEDGEDVPDLGAQEPIGENVEGALMRPPTLIPICRRMQ
jgi:hypothetical protein